MIAGRKAGERPPRGERRLSGAPRALGAPQTQPDTLTLLECLRAPELEIPTFLLPLCAARASELDFQNFVTAIIWLSPTSLRPSLPGPALQSPLIGYQTPLPPSYFTSPNPLLFFSSPARHHRTPRRFLQRIPTPPQNRLSPLPRYAGVWAASSTHHPPILALSGGPSALATHPCA